MFDSHYLINLKLSFVVAGSRALVASSHNNILGCVTNALAMATRCFCPPDNSSEIDLFISKPHKF